MSKIVFALLAIMLVGYVGYVSWLYYAGTCQQIKEFPITTHVPNRCIKL